MTKQRLNDADARDGAVEPPSDRSPDGAARATAPTPDPTPSPTPGPSPATSDPQVAVTVARTGGIAGIRREWQASAPPAAPQPLIALIDACPWDAPVPASSGADRFVWHLTAVVDSATHEQTLPDGALTGAWRALVDSVQAGAADGR